MPPGSRTKPPSSIDRPRVGPVEVAPGGALVATPRRCGVIAASLSCVARSSRRISAAVLTARANISGVVAVDDREVLEAEAEAEAHVVEGDAAALELEVGERAAHGARHVEGVALARAGEPVDAGAARRDEAVDVGALRRQVERHHHRPERPDVLDPGRLR